MVNPVIYPMLNSKTILKNEIIKRANEGLFYITTEEKADKIIEESLISTPDPFISFGLKKPVFYGGIPELPVACFDLKLPTVITAIKLNIPYETLALFQIEMNGHAYKLFYPNLLLEPFELKKVYLGLTVKDFQFCYQEIKEEEKNNYVVQIPQKEIKAIEKKLAKELKGIISIIKQKKKLYKI